MHVLSRIFGPPIGWLIVTYLIHTGWMMRRVR
jgi:hypothetical protein